MADAPLTSTHDAVVQALKDAIGVISSINGGHANRVMKNGEAVYWQRKEWIDWARLEVMPTIQAALDGLTRAAQPATPDWYKLEMLKAAAQSGNPAVIAFAAQLAGVPPCDACGYVKAHCRCAATPSPPVAAVPATPVAHPNLGAAPQNGWDAWTHAAQPQPQPAQPLTGAQIAAITLEEWGPCSLMHPATIRKWSELLTRAVERAHGITAPSTPTPPEVAP